MDPTPQIEGRMVGSAVEPFSAATFGATSRTRAKDRARFGRLLTKCEMAADFCIIVAAVACSYALYHLTHLGKQVHYLPFSVLEMAGVFAMPVLPGLTDGEAELDALARASGEAGAQWFGARAVFLMSSSLKQFLPFLEKRFPRLVRQYREWYGRGGYAPEPYRRELSERVQRLRQKYGLGPLPVAKDWELPGKQLCLALGDAPGAETEKRCGE